MIQTALILPPTALLPDNATATQTDAWRWQHTLALGYEQAVRASQHEQRADRLEQLQVAAAARDIARQAEVVKQTAAMENQARAMGDQAAAMDKHATAMAAWVAKMEIAPDGTPTPAATKPTRAQLVWKMMEQLADDALREHAHSMFASPAAAVDVAVQMTDAYLKAFPDAASA